MCGSKRGNPDFIVYMFHHFCCCWLFFDCRRIYYFKTISKLGFKGSWTIYKILSLLFLNPESAHINDTATKEDDFKMVNDQFQRGFYWDLYSRIYFNHRLIGFYVKNGLFYDFGRHGILKCMALIVLSPTRWVNLI